MVYYKAVKVIIDTFRLAKVIFDIVDQYYGRFQLIDQKTCFTNINQLKSCDLYNKLSKNYLGYGSIILWLFSSINSNQSLVFALKYLISAILLLL